MQVDEGFRNLKSVRYGLAFRHNLGRNPRRLAILLLLGALATLALWVLGLYACQSGIGRTLQANTVTDKPVLSVVFIGQRLVARSLDISKSEFTKALERLRHRAAQQLVAFLTCFVGISQGAAPFFLNVRFR